MTVTGASYDVITEDFARRFGPDFVDAWNSHDPERLVALADAHVRWEDPSIDGGSLEGHARMRTWLEQMWRAMPDLTFALDGETHLALGSRSVMLAWTGHATMTGPLVPPGFAPTSRPVRMSGVDTLWFRDGRLVRVRSHSDLMDLARQIGAAPPAHSVGERAGVLLQRLAAARMRRSARR
jgi:predicted ester cyclase